ncbi:hypothetical protein LTR94_034727, partial [Friedmanniomyces endolithicus]
PPAREPYHQSRPARPARAAAGHQPDRRRCRPAHRRSPALLRRIGAWRAVRCRAGHAIAAAKERAGRPAIVRRPDRGCRRRSSGRAVRAPDVRRRPQSDGGAARQQHDLHRIQRRARVGAGHQ